MKSTYDEVKQIIIDLLGADENKVTLDARFREDLEADSLDLVELIMAFEDHFGAKITDKEAQNINTVGEAIQYLQVGARPPGDSTTDAPPPAKKKKRKG